MSEQPQRSERDPFNEDEWPDDSPAGRAPQTEITANYIRLFVESILHGDDDHRLWLKEAAECFIDGRPMPDRPCPCLKPEQPQVEDSPWREWTLQRLMPYMGKRDNYKSLLDDINAALAAERETSTDLRALCEANLGTMRKMEQQLLQAQAVIAEHNERWSKVHSKITIDLSALDKHDAEVRAEHDAALAAEGDKWRKALTAASDLAKQTFAEKDKQLAAEQRWKWEQVEKVKTLVDCLTEIREHEPFWVPWIDDVLEKVK
jgi:hypothetical protein